jgi:phosphonate transport system substrate-binding protein
MKRLLILLAFLPSLILAQSSSLPTGLRIGIVPNVTTSVLMTNYTPLKDFFVAQGLRQTTLQTTETFAEFHEKTVANAYDILITPPHMARLAQIDYKYVPLVAMAPNVRALMITNDMDSTVPVSIKGSQVAYANPQSLVAMIGSKWLQGKGLQAETDYKVLAVPREDTIGRLVAEGEAKYGILSNAELRAVPEKYQSKIRVVEVIADIPNFVVMGNSHLSTYQLVQLRDLLQRFADISPQGASFFNLTGFTSMRQITAAQLKTMDAYLIQTRKLFEAGREGRK